MVFNSPISPPFLSTQNANPRGFDGYIITKETKLTTKNNHESHLVVSTDPTGIIITKYYKLGPNQIQLELVYPLSIGLQPQLPAFKASHKGYNSIYN